EAKAPAAKLVLLCGGTDQRHRTGVKQILEVQGLCQFCFFLLASDFRVVRPKPEPVTPSTPFALRLSKGRKRVSVIRAPSPEKSSFRNRQPPRAINASRLFLVDAKRRRSVGDASATRR